jgi:hypothetical protein
MGVCLYCWFSHQVCKSHLFCAALYCQIWPVWLYLISPHYLVKWTIFERAKEEVIERKTCVLIFFTTFVLDISHSTKNSARYYYKCTYNGTWTAGYSCQILNTPELSLQVFEKFSNTKFQKKSVQWEPSSSMRTDGRTGMTKLILAFSNFANAPKNVVCATPKVLNANKINYRVHTILIKVYSIVVTNLIHICFIL